jgi:hypothetical protein
VGRTTLIVILLVAVLAVMAFSGWRIAQSSLGTAEKFAAMGTVVAVLGVIVTVVVLFVPSDIRDYDLASPLRTSGATAVTPDDATTPASSTTPASATPTSSRESTPTPPPSNQAHPKESTESTESTESSGSSDRPKVRQSAPRKSSTGTRIRATQGVYAGLCMAASGDAVETATCGQASNQLWRSSAQGELVTSDGRCMTTDADHGGVRMTVATCDQSTGQQWHFTDGRITSGRLELTIYGPYVDPGHPIQTWDTSEDPTPAPEMYWELS